MTVRENLASSASSQKTDVPPEPILNEASKEPNSDPEKSDLEQSDRDEAAVPVAYGSDAPDGGLTAWLVVLGAWCTSFCSFGWVNSTSHHLLFSVCYGETKTDKYFRCRCIPRILPE